MAGMSYILQHDGSWVRYIWEQDPAVPVQDNVLRIRFRDGLLHGHKAGSAVPVSAGGFLNDLKFILSHPNIYEVIL